MCRHAGAARAVGAAVGICVLCQGEKGQPTPPVQDLSEVRRAEMEDAAALLGAELYFGGCPDGELFDGPEQRRKVIDLLREFRPTLLLAHAPEDHHPDYRAASALAESASWYCALRGYVTDVPAVPLSPARWWMDTVNQADFVPGFFVDVSEHLELKQQMLACHQSQLRRGSDHGILALDELLVERTRRAAPRPVCSLPKPSAFTARGSVRPRDSVAVTLRVAGSSRGA